MNKDGLEDRIYGMALQSVVAARGLIDEPHEYAALRVVDMVSELVAILDENDLASDRLREMKDRIDEASSGSMQTEDELKEFLDATIMEGLDRMG